MEDFIQVKRDNIIKIGIKDENGNKTDKFLEFDLEDIELPLRYQELLEQHKKNLNYVKHQFIIIDKREDIKGNKFFSKNEEEKIKVVLEFYKREMAALDLLLGEGKTQMILDVMKRKPYFEMFDDIAEALKPMSKVFEENALRTTEVIKQKYGDINDEVLK